MKKYYTLTLMALLVAIPSNGQLWNRLNNAACNATERAVERNVEKKIDQAVDKAIDDMFAEDEQQTESNTNAQQKKTNENRNATLSNSLMKTMGMGDVPHENSYSYNTKMSLYIENTTNENQVSKGYFNSYFNDATLDYAMEFTNSDKPQETGLIVYDKKNSVILVLNNENGEKSGLAMQLPPDTTVNNKQEQQEALSDEELATICPYYKATGRTKNISGYNCREYKYTTEYNANAELTIWVTRDVKYDYSNAYQYMGVAMLSTYGLGSYLLGTVMEMHLTDKINGEHSDLYIKEINTQSNKTIDLSGYQIIGFNGTGK